VSVFKSLPGCKAAAILNQTALASSVVHLYKQGFNPTPSTPLADYTAQEADYTGYATQTITAFADPILAPGSGYQIQGPLQQFVWTGALPGVSNNIAGAYLVDSGGTLIDVIKFTDDSGNPVSIPMGGPDQAVQVAFVELFPTGV
jgi:hypothetical protein